MKMVSTLNEESIEKKLKTVTNTQDSIQTLSLWIIHHKANHAKIVELWMRVLRRTVQPSHRLTLFYLCNDVVQTCKKKNAFVYNTTFKECLTEAASLVRDQTVKDKVGRIFNIWEERGVYEAAFIKSLQSILNGQQMKFGKVHDMEKDASNSPISPVSTPQGEPELKETAAEPDSDDNVSDEMDAEESAQILADFKPHAVIDQITAFKHQEAEIQSRISQLTHLNLDISTLEAVKQLKDRVHGNDFTSQFDDSFKKLEDLVKRQAHFLEDQRSLLGTLRVSEMFYEEQYREAKIVANAYKNFGARINNMKKKLDELKKTMPEPDSPVPSPDVKSSSPSSTPSHTSGPSYSYSPGDPVSYGQGQQKKSRVYSETESVGGASVTDSIPQDNATFMDSTPTEALTPESSPPPDQNLGASDNVGMSLDSRLASFFGRNPRESPSSSAYAPQLAYSVVDSSKLKTSDDDDDDDDNDEDDGGGSSSTPVDDETPTTPVLDENLATPPKQDTPPKKENPIDFLSRLISQTQNVPVKTGTQSFLDSLTMLSMTSKKSEPVDSQHQTASPQSWTSWESKSVESVLPNQHVLPSSCNSPSSLPTSPHQFPPPPAVASPPVSIPPAPLSTGMNIPPPPPLFVLSPVISPDFPAVTPGFQLTSPEPKMNWPEMKLDQSVDHSGSSKVVHSSVLKELTPADSAEVSPALHQQSPKSVFVEHKELMNVEEDGRLESASRTVVEAKAEFIQKLKQKNQSALKSHVFVQNPERPNLMTLTVSDDLEEEDMLDNDPKIEEAVSWSEKSSKSSRRSRSQSREKDSFHKLKKKKDDNHYKDNEDSRPSDYSSKDIFGTSSVIKKVEPITRQNSRDINNKVDNFCSERFNKHSNDWKYSDQRHDRNYSRYNDDQWDRRSPRDSCSSKDSVQAYAQAYKEAFFKQYAKASFNHFLTGPPPMDPRRPFYGKY